MTITLYGIPNCDTVKKARAWLDAKGIAYTFHDYKKAGADPAKIAAWIAAAGRDRIVNRAGTTFRKLSAEDQAALDIALERLAHQPRMQAIMAAADFAQTAPQPVLFSSTEASWKLASLASLYGLKPIFKSDKLLNISQLHASKKCTLLFLSKGQAVDTTQVWLQKHRAELVWEEGDRRLYRIVIGE